MPTFLLISAVVQGPGSILITPVSEDGLYDGGTIVTMVVSCEAGFDGWTGEVPSGVFPTSKAIQVTMDQDRRLVALCAPSTAVPPTAVPTRGVHAGADGDTDSDADSCAYGDTNCDADAGRDSGICEWGPLGDHLGDGR